MWQARRDWPAETPTAARVDREHRDDGGKGKGSKGKGGKAWNRRTSVPYDLSVEKLKFAQTVGFWLFFFGKITRSKKGKGKFESGGLEGLTLEYGSCFLALKCCKVRFPKRESNFFILIANSRAFRSEDPALYCNLS